MTSSLLQAPPSSIASRPRLGFVGVGWIGRLRLDAIVESDVAEVVAIVDSVRDRALQASASAPSAVVLGSLDESLDAALDGLVIATPSALHAEQAIAALDRGIAVFCQKPLGRTAGETRRIIDAARSADRLLAVDLSYRFTRAAQIVREHLRAGGIGDVYAVDMVFHNAYGPQQAWFYDRTLSGGGCVVDLGIHLIDLLLWALEFPRIERVTSHLFAGGEPLGDRRVVEDYAVATLELSGGVVARLGCSWRLHAGRDAVIEATFYGTGGGVSLRNVGGSFYDFVAERFDGTASTMLVGPPDAWGGRAAVDWARRLAAGERFDPTVTRLVDVAAALDEVYGR